VTGVVPSQNHPVSRGTLCVKGWYGHDFIHHPDRLKHPLVRKDRDLVRASWDEALGIVADRLKAISLAGAENSRASGLTPLGFLTSAKATNEENYLMQKIARAVFKTHNVDHCARL
jgi:predicted molibdopterin-dependent oxidoreductase YjgC